MSCPLCFPNISSEDFNVIWYAFQERVSYDDAVSEGAKHNIVFNVEEFKKHLKAHDWVQPAPKKSLRRGQALEKVNSLPNERLRTVLRLVARVPALSGSQIAEILYWDGDESKLHSARNQCYQDLKNLVYKDLLYRWTPTSNRLVSLPNRKNETIFYFLGRDSVPYVEEREGIYLQRKEWMTKPDSAGDQTKIFLFHEQSEIFSVLQNQNKKNKQKSYVMGEECKTFFNPLNWWGTNRCTIKIDDPISQINKISPDGIACVSVDIQSRNFSTLLPFFYELDSGIKNIDNYSNTLLSYLALTRSDSLIKRFPDLPDEFCPPVLVISQDPNRIVNLKKAVTSKFQTMKLGEETPPPIVITDKISFEYHGMNGLIWQSIWDSSNNPMNLMDVLIRVSKPVLVKSSHLNSESVLLYSEE